MRTLLLAFALLLPILPARAQDLAADTRLVGRAERLVDAFLAGDYEAASVDFDSTMRAVLPPDKLAEAGYSIAAQAGALEERGGAQVERKPPYTIVSIPLFFERAALAARVVFDAGGRVTGLFFQPNPGAVPYTPPAYVDTTAFRERDVTVDAGENLPLEGRLTVPVGEGPFPAVVLVHGSGPNDLDETIGPNKVFRDLAWGLAARGVAVLRYDKRTRAYGGAFQGRPFTVEDEVVADAVAALETLRAVPEVDAARTFVVGHSLGAMLAPRIVARAEGTAGAVLLAAPGRPLDVVMRDQLDYLGTLDTLGLQAAPLADLRAELDRLADLQALPDTTTVAGVPAAYWRDLNAYDPVATAAGLGVPLLLLYGGRDYQVTAPDRQRWAPLAERPGVTLTVFPALNHLFVAGEGPSTPGEYMAPGHVAAEVVEAVAAWIADR